MYLICMYMYSMRSFQVLVHILYMLAWQWWVMFGQDKLEWLVADDYKNYSGLPIRYTALWPAESNYSQTSADEGQLAQKAVHPLSTWQFALYTVFHIKTKQEPWWVLRGLPCTPLLQSSPGRPGWHDSCHRKIDCSSSGYAPLWTHNTMRRPKPLKVQTLYPCTSIHAVLKIPLTGAIYTRVITSQMVVHSVTSFSLLFLMFSTLYMKIWEYLSAQSRTLTRRNGREVEEGGVSERSEEQRERVGKKKQRKGEREGERKRGK